VYKFYLGAPHWHLSHSEWMLITHSVGFNLENTIFIAEFKVLIRINIRPLSIHIDQTSFVNKRFIITEEEHYFLARHSR